MAISLPLDQARMGTTLVLSVAPDTDQTGAQKMNGDNVPVWKVETLLKPPAREDGSAPKSETVYVKLAGRTAPQLAEFTPVRFHGLTARMWEMNGKSGISFSADSVEAPKGGEGR